MNPKAPQPPNLGRGGLRGFCEKQRASHTTGALCRARAEPPADPGFIAHPVSSGTNQNTPATGNHRVCLFLELRKMPSPQAAVLRGQQPWGIHRGRGAGRSNPSRYQSWGLDKPKAEPHPGGSEVKRDGSRDASRRHLLNASGPCCPQSGAGRAHFHLPQPLSGRSSQPVTRCNNPCPLTGHRPREAQTT